jgi:hypothetical protein
MTRVSEELKKPTRIRAAYRVPVVVRPRVGDRKIDLGPLERLLSITVPQTLHTKTVSVTGRVSGGVWLDDNRREIRLEDSYRRGATETYRVVTDNPAVELSVVKEECKPAFLGATLEKLPPARDRGYHNLKIVVPKESKAGLWSGVIVLETKGPNPQRIRIPVFGKGGT